MPELESVVGFLNELLGVEGHPDYRTALNGLQVGGPAGVDHVATAVDASVATIGRASDVGADLLIVHHGTFWGGVEPLVGRQLERVSGLIEGKVALYSAHLPLDAHPEVGNCAILIREIGLEPTDRFGEFEGAPLGFRASAGDLPLEDLVERVRGAIGGGRVQVIEGAGPTSGDVAVVTGGGGSFIPAAAAAGVRTLVTGEGSHHTFIDAHELGVNVIYAGHYATETFGVRALGELLVRKFGVTHTFIDIPSGL